MLITVFVGIKVSIIQGYSMISVIINISVISCPTKQTSPLARVTTDEGPCACEVRHSTEENSKTKMESIVSVEQDCVVAVTSTNEDRNVGWMGKQN